MVGPEKTWIKSAASGHAVFEKHSIEILIW